MENNWLIMIKEFLYQPAHQDLFHKLYTKYDELEQAKDQIKYVSTIAAQLQDELTMKNKQHEQHITKLIEEEKENEEFSHMTVVGLKNEIANLKAQLKRQEQKIENPNQTIQLEQSFEENNQNQYTHDVFYTPRTPKNNRRNIANNPKTTTPKGKAELQFSPTNHANQITAEETSEKLIHASSLQPIGISEDSIKYYLESIDKNVRTILSNIENEGNKITSQNIELAPEPTNKAQHKAETQKQNQNLAPTLVNLLIIGDQHASGLEPSLARSLPNHITIETLIKDGADFPKLSLEKIHHRPSHVILSAGTHDVQKTPIFEIKEAINKLLRKFKSSTVHYIQIPERFDQVNLNYHIDRVNRSVAYHLRKYKNVIIYKTNEIVNNWDYNNTTQINKNGYNKLSREIKRNLWFKSSEYPRKETRKNQQISKGTSGSIRKAPHYPKPHLANFKPKTNERTFYNTHFPPLSNKSNHQHGRNEPKSNETTLRSQHKHYRRVFFYNSIGDKSYYAEKSKQTQQYARDFTSSSTKDLDQRSSRYKSPGTQRSTNLVSKHNF
ncbi:hypothetical protein WDU94_009823 [Cyamophila willieti]